MISLPDVLQTAIQHHQAGRLQEAEALYRQILQVEPNHPDALHLLGVIAHQAGKHEIALEYIARAIALNPAAEYHNNIGEAYRALARLNEAGASFQQALALNPVFAEAMNNLGAVLQTQGKLEGAVAQYRRALEIKPGYAQAHSNLGNALRAQGKLDEAVAQYRQALALTPRDVAVQISLAGLLHGRGHTLDALMLLFNGLTEEPSNVQLRRALAAALHGYELHTAGEQARAILLRLFQDDDISSQNLAAVVAGLARNSPAFLPLLSASQNSGDPFREEIKELDAFLNDPVFLSALPRLVLCNGELERVLTHLRRWILLRSARHEDRPAADPGVSHPFLCALAMQCFNTEYAWFASRDEARMVSNLRTTLKAVLRRSVKDLHALERSLVLVALYDSLHNLPGWERLLKPELSQWSESFRLIVREQLHNHKKEQDITARLTALTGIRDAVSRKVRRQYEDNPYPRWMTTNRPQARTIESLARSLRPGEMMRAFPRPASILVAGCGTGQQPIQTAMAFGDCDVLAVDLSRASLAYAVRMAERFGVTSVTFQQADILEMGELDRRFHLIDCGGVLHHLKDPLKGWRVLVGLMEPDGLMKIALYSSRARRNIQAARRFVRARKFPPTPEGVRKCRRAILDLPEGHPARGALTFRDFFSNSECRDLIMHVQEHTFTASEIADCLNQLGLRFLGFECDLKLQERFRAMFPDQTAFTDLARWNRFEEANPDTFTSMYQFWCCRK